VDPNRFHPDVPPASDAAPWHRHSDTLFAMVGTLGTGVNKRVDIGIRALSEARQRGASVGLVIAGDGVQRNHLEQLATACGVADYTHFLGMRQDVPQVLAACDAFCHAAPFEPFGIVALEAMAMARPVIVPDQGGICEAVDNGETGFVYPTLNIEALADAMCRIDRK